MDKIVISPNEITEIKEAADQPAKLEPPRLPPAIPWWARLSVGILVLFLPLLCLVTIILRVAFRGQSPRIRYAWTSYLSTLLIISGFLTSASAVVFFSVGGSFQAPIAGNGLSELDERTDFPALPAGKDLNGADAALELKPLVAVISPAAQSFFGKREMLSNSFGAGLLLEANDKGYLFATARHVIGLGNWSVKDKHKALLSLASGIWSESEVIARHNNLDLVLIWLPRHSGSADFVQPIATAKEGENIFVIGHPEGLRYTLSTGIVSRMENSTLQISAPISPGNSGGPVYDQLGNLLGVVSSTLDKSYQPNAENLNFAVTAQALLKENGWEFAKDGRERLQEYLKAMSEREEKAKKEHGN
jgi:S1-C subfamily serine protease